MRWKIFFAVLLLLVLTSILFVSAEENAKGEMVSLLLKEQVKCIFLNSDAQQKCYTTDGVFGCYGIGSCVADVSGEQGTKLSWESSCEGAASTVIDESNEYAEFKCVSEKPAPQAKLIVNEQVKCIFANSEALQKCSTENDKFGCSGSGTCIADVSGEQGTKLTWKSSCEGVAYTVVDESNEYAEFKCVSEKAEPTPLPQLAKARVKCVFIGSDAPQQCNSDNGAFGWFGL